MCRQLWGSQHVRRGQCDGRAVLPAAEAEHRRRPKSTAAQPIPESGDVVPPCLGVSQALAREGTKLLCTDLQQHGETTAEGMIAVLPFAGNFSSGRLPPGEAVCALHAAAAVDSACSIPSVQIHVGMTRLPHGMVRLAARMVPRCISNHVITVARGVAHAVVESFQSAARRAKAACFLRGSMPACRGMPSSVPAVWDGRW
ncbi:hypothetical protein TcCL_NonESM07861 [Trypanosoma cruzi]|nr:hypothetical protein TcCL_NonESM07861 [Trypanosoma cruzi]